MSDEDDDGLMTGQTQTIRDRTEELSSALTHTGENKAKQWFLLTGSRLVVTGVLLTLVFFALLGLSFINPIGMRDLLNETNAAITLFSSLLGGAILLVSIVVSINSVVFSQAINDIENQQERIDASIEYRRNIENYIKTDVTPARPAEFLTTVMYAISRQMEAVFRMAEDTENQTLREQVDEFANQVEGEIQQARETLSNARLGTFTVLRVGLNYNYSGQLHAARTLKREFSDDLTDDQLSAIDDLIETFKHMATGREYFKSLYYKRELARLSSLLLYVSLPVIVFTSYVILALDARLFPEIGLFGLSPLLISVIFAYTVALAPYIVLTAFIVRASTITLRTLDAGPFILQTGGDIDMYDWEGPDESREWSLTDRVDDE